jgi:hypothetical protein
MNTLKKIECFACHKPLGLEPAQKIGKNEECEYCYASIHSCRMCSFYDAKAYNQCREPSAERIVEKEKANYCDYFVLQSHCADGNEQLSENLNKFNSLFKN